MLSFWFYFAFCSGLTAAVTYTDVYVSPDRGSTSVHCGSDNNSPCLGLSSFLNRTGHLIAVGQILLLNGSIMPQNQRLRVHLNPGTYETDPIFLYRTNHMSFSGIGSVVIRVNNFHNMFGYKPLWQYMFSDVSNNYSHGYPAAVYFRECLDIEIRNLQFSVSREVISLSGLTVDESRNVNITDCSVTEVASVSSAAVLINLSGSILVSRFIIQDLFRQQGFQHLILIVFNCSLNGSENGAFADVILSNVTVRNIMRTNCTFCTPSLSQIISGAIAYPSSDYQFDTKYDGIVLVQFLESAQGNTFTLENSVIEGIQVIQGAPVSIVFKSGSKNNVSIHNCSFAHNSGYFGGSLAFSFSNTANSNAITVSDCLFESSSALYSGGAVSIEYFHDRTENSVTFERCHFYGNNATFGGAIMSRLTLMNGFKKNKFVSSRLLRLVDCEFVNNSAIHGIIDVVSIKIEVFGTSLFMGNNESCFGLRQSILNFYDHPRFIRNVALNGAAVIVHTESQVNLANVTMAWFEDNFAKRRGGVIWADHDSTAVTYNQFLLDSIKCIDTTQECFIIFGNERTYYPCDTNMPTQKVQENVYGTASFCYKI